MSNKTLEIRELVSQLQLDILGLTETWLNQFDSAKIKELLSPDTHDFYHISRDGIGGGVGILLSKKFTNIKLCSQHKYKSFEHIEINFYLVNKVFKFIVIYRTPPKTNFDDFMEEISNLMSAVYNEDKSIYICGDFNVWVEDRSDQYARKFMEVLDVFDCRNVIETSTSLSDHILDLLICENSDDRVRDVEVEPDFFLSYFHGLVTLINLKIKTTEKYIERIPFRFKNAFESEDFIDGVVTLLEVEKLRGCPCRRDHSSDLKCNDCVNCLVTIYNRLFGSEYDERCPTIEKFVIKKESCPWFTTEVVVARRERIREKVEKEENN